LRNKSDEIIPHRYEDDEEEEVNDEHQNDTYLAGLSLERRAARSHSTVYSVRNGQSHLGRFITYSKDYQPGEPLDGAFDFTHASLRCYRVSGGSSIVIFTWRQQGVVKSTIIIIINCGPLTAVIPHTR